MRQRLYFLSQFIWIGLLCCQVGLAQQPTMLEAENKPLPSLSAAIAQHRASHKTFTPQAPPSNYLLFNPLDDQALALHANTGYHSPPQSATGTTPFPILKRFSGFHNDGSQPSPGDPVGDVGREHYVQVVNSVTTVFDKDGTMRGNGPFPNQVFWQGTGDLCEKENLADPILLYDEALDRWFLGIVAFNNARTQQGLCLAISQTGDPLGGYHRYLFEYPSLPDYPKFGITSASITATIIHQHITLAAIDKAALYAGRSVRMVSFVLDGNNPTPHYLPADLDDPTATARFVPALFASALSDKGLFEIQQIDVDWSRPAEASLRKVAEIPIARPDLRPCARLSEPCIEQPAPGIRLNHFGSVMMHRLQIRDFGSRLSMLASHLVDADKAPEGTQGRMGIRWFELRSDGQHWSIHQEGIYAPTDRKYRWMGSLAMNAAGDIGAGFVLASKDNFMSVAVTGQTKAFSGSGGFDLQEKLCSRGLGLQTQPRTGDYSAMSVDPVTDTFWHTNSYIQTEASLWSSFVCEWSTIIPAEVLTENPTGGTTIALMPGQKAAQAFRITTPENGFYGIERIRLHLSRDPNGPDQPLEVSLGTNINGGYLKGFPIPATEITNTSAGASFAPYEGILRFGSLYSGQTYYLNLHHESTNGKPYYLEITPSNAYPDGVFYEQSVATGKDLRFQILGNPANPSANEPTASPPAFLLQNYPNPFQDRTTIAYDLDRWGPVRLRVYDMLGRTVSLLVDQSQPPGSYEVTWEPSGSLASGVYYVLLEQASLTQGRLLIKRK